MYGETTYTDEMFRKVEEEVFNGVGEANCPECGRLHQVEVDAEFECHTEGCEGIVRSMSMELGII